VLLKELEFGQNIDAGIELTGAGLVQGNKAYQIDEVAKGIDSVTEEQLKEVSYINSVAIMTTADDLYRLPRLSSRTRLQCHLSVTFTCSHTLASLASRCRGCTYDSGCEGRKNVPLKLYSRLTRRLDAIFSFVNKAAFSSFNATSVDLQSFGN
jgi:hypothetical protein